MLIMLNAAYLDPAVIDGQVEGVQESAIVAYKDMVC
jgi:hypothetical protein